MMSNWTTVLNHASLHNILWPNCLGFKISVSFSLSKCHVNEFLAIILVIISEEKLLHHHFFSLYGKYKKLVHSAKYLLLSSMHKRKSNWFAMT